MLIVESDASGLEYDACLSFAGEERGYVELVARGLKDAGLRVFYDEDEKVWLWGKDLIEHFDRIYRVASRYCVMFISAAYAAKEWTRLERRSALARALTEQGEYILPARFDDTELPGMPPTIAYIELSELAPATLVEFIVEKGRPAGSRDQHRRRDVEGRARRGVGRRRRRKFSELIISRCDSCWPGRSNLSRKARRGRALNSVSY